MLRINCPETGDMSARLTRASRQPFQFSPRTFLQGCSGGSCCLQALLGGFPEASGGSLFVGAFVWIQQGSSNEVRINLKTASASTNPCKAHNLSSLALQHFKLFSPLPKYSIYFILPTKVGHQDNYHHPGAPLASFPSCLLVLFAFNHSLLLGLLWLLSHY